MGKSSKSNESTSFERLNEVYRELRLAIFQRAELYRGKRLAPGTQLREVDIQDHFAITRGAARKIIRRLQEDGLWHNQGNGGGIPSVSPINVQLNLNLRCTNELLAACQLAKHHERGKTEHQLRAVHQVFLERINAGKDYSLVDVVDADLDFHSCIIDTAQCSVIRPALRQLHQQLILFYPNIQSPERQQAIATDHLRIIESIESGELSAVVQAYKQHLMNPPVGAEEHFVRIFEETEAFFDLAQNLQSTASATKASRD